jgi:hypothetical protein
VTSPLAHLRDFEHHEASAKWTTLMRIRLKAFIPNILPPKTREAADSE